MWVFASAPATLRRKVPTGADMPDPPAFAIRRDAFRDRKIAGNEKSA